MIKDETITPERIERKLALLTEWNACEQASRDFDQRELARVVCDYLETWLELHDITYHFNYRQNQYVQGKRESQV